MATPLRRLAPTPVPGAATLLLATLLLGALVVGCSDGDSAPARDESDGSTTTEDTTAEVAADPVTAAEPGEVATAAPRPSPGCDDPLTDQVDLFRHDLSVAGEDRHYLVSTPPSDGEPLPLVVDLHGLMEGAEIHATMTRYGPFARDHGVVVAFPHGRGEPVRWSTDPATGGPDLELIDTMLEQIGTERCIDEARVYATGLSNGAMMTSYLACERSEVFAAVAPVGGIEMPEGCEPGRPVPVLSTHGTADPILLFNGGIGDLGSLFGGEPTGDTPTTTTTTIPTDLEGPGYPGTVAEWAALNGCEDSFTDTEVTAEVVHRSYDCPPGAATEFSIVLGGGHSWPGSDFSAGISDIVGPTTFDIDATELSWEFFRRFAL